MKRSSILFLLLTMTLAGCVSKSSFSVIFDQFTMRFYDNRKTYIEMTGATSSMGMMILSQMQEEAAEGSSGFINSLFIVKTPYLSGTDLKTLVASNTKTLTHRLLKYTDMENRSKAMKCGDTEYSGYITSFSYQLDKQNLFDGQYFFQSDGYLYVISLSTDDKKDITSFMKSLKGLKCID